MRRLDPTRRLLLWAALSLSAVSLSGPALAEEAGVPPKVQAALFKKIFAYDAALQAQGSLHVLVVYPAGAAAAAREMVAAFTEVGLSASGSDERAAQGQLKGASVVYVVAGASSPESLAKDGTPSVLSVSGSAALAEGGEVSVGLGKSQDGRPEIVVHRGRLKAEGHELSAALLRLARVVK